MSNVKELRQLGYKVRVIHNRVMVGDKPYPRGGHTVVEITTPDQKELYGVARCSDEDGYNKKLGVKIAIGRAMVSKGE